MRNKSVWLVSRISGWRIMASAQVAGLALASQARARTQSFAMGAAPGLRSLSRSTAASTSPPCTCRHRPHSYAAARVISAISASQQRPVGETNLPASRGQCSPRSESPCDQRWTPCLHPPARPSQTRQACERATKEGADGGGKSRKVAVQGLTTAAPSAPNLEARIASKLLGRVLAMVAPCSAHPQLPLSPASHG